MWITYCQEVNFCHHVFASSHSHFTFELNFGILSPMERSTKFQKIKRKRKHGFRSRLKTANGRKLLKRRRDKKRKRVSI